jgi:hypothetical protein
VNVNNGRIPGTPAQTNVKGDSRTMPEHFTQIATLRELRNFVQEQLCDQNELEVGAFQFTERVLQKGESPCGVFFCLHGPRSVKLVAIWETSHNKVLFYGSTGERVGQIQLAQGPTLA